MNPSSLVIRGLILRGIALTTLLALASLPCLAAPASDGTSIQSMLPIGDSGPPPTEYLKDDLLVRVAPRQMEYYAARVVRPAP